MIFSSCQNIRIVQYVVEQHGGLYRILYIWYNINTVSVLFFVNLVSATMWQGGSMKEGTKYKLVWRLFLVLAVALAYGMYVGGTAIYKAVTTQKSADHEGCRGQG